MGVVQIRFYAELNDFLPQERRARDLRRHFDVEGSVKDLIESVGVPHTEIDLVLVNGEPVSFSHRVRDGDRVSVFPVFESFDISNSGGLQPIPLRDLRFLLDVHLGRLARYLRMAGFDAEYANEAEDAELAATVSQTGRVLLTRDRFLLMRSKVERGYWLRSTDAREQLAEVVRRFDLVRNLRPFTRCMRCNTSLVPVDREEVHSRIPPTVSEQSELRQCPQCERVYWKGSHHARMAELIEDLRHAT